jgi:hypothetical protein
VNSKMVLVSHWPVILVAVSLVPSVDNVMSIVEAGVFPLFANGFSNSVDPLMEHKFYFYTRTSGRCTPWGSTRPTRPTRPTPLASRKTETQARVESTIPTYSLPALEHESTEIDTS